MSKVFGSSGKRSNPIGFVSIFAGLCGAACSAVLWIYRIHPESRLLGSFSAEVASGGTLARQLATLAAVLGVMAILAAITATSGGSGGSYFVGLVLGLAALSYPVLTWLKVVSGPLQPSFLH